MTEPIIHRLSAPAQAHGEEITALTLRPVRGEDIAACGYPFTVNNLFELTADAENIKPDITFHGPALIAMVARLAGVPRSTVAALPAVDIWQLGYEVVSFFLPAAPAPAKSSNDASTSPGFGDARPPLSLASISGS